MDSGKYLHEHNKIIFNNDMNENRNLLNVSRLVHYKYQFAHAKTRCSCQNKMLMPKQDAHAKTRSPCQNQQYMPKSVAHAKTNSLCQNQQHVLKLAAHAKTRHTCQNQRLSSTCQTTNSPPYLKVVLSLRLT